MHRYKTNKKKASSLQVYDRLSTTATIPETHTSERQADFCPICMQYLRLTSKKHCILSQWLAESRGPCPHLLYHLR